MSLGVATEVIGGSALALGAYASVRLLAMKSDSQIYGRTLVAGSDPDELALTFDDGPNDRSTPELLEVLHREGVRATFFMLGRYVRERPDLVRAVQREGHIVGNHTMTHPSLARTSIQVMREEIQGCTQLLEEITGAPVRYFRAPFGARRPAVLRSVRELGLVPVQWNAHGRDWDPIGVDAILGHLERRVERARRSGRGANVLLHDGSNAGMGSDRGDTVRATEILIRRTRERGRRIVAIDAWG